MEKPKKCESGFNMKHIDLDQRHIRMLCLFGRTREILKDLLESVGGQESSGICSECEDYAEWWMNQPAEPVEETTRWDMIDDRCQKWRLDDLRSA